MSKKFAFILTNLTGGGAEKAILKVSAGLAARGHEAHIVLLEHVIEHAVPDSAHLHVLTPAGARVHRGAIGKWWAVRRLRRAMAHLARPRLFDLIVSTLPFADEIAVRAQLPRHWCRIANTLSAEIDRLRADTPAKADRRLARYHHIYGARPLIAVSDGVAQDLRGELGLTKTRIERIYNPFDLAAMRVRAKEPATLPEGSYVIHVGRFSAQKRHDLLLDAWRQFDGPQRLVLLTDSTPQLEAMIETRGLAGRVTIAGFKANPYPWIAGADLLVLCSDHEGLPNVIIEALVVGTPVVSTDCPSGPREILGAAYPECLVPVGDKEALLAAIRRALSMPTDPSRVNLAAFDSENVLADYERLAAEP